jgi:hypothetical protein
MNQTLQLVKERVLTLDPKVVEAYLQSHGWEEDARASSPEAGVYHLPGDTEAEVVVPRDRSLVDYALRLGEVLQALAAVEHRTAWEVLEDLLAPAADSSANSPAASPRGASPEPAVAEKFHDLARRWKQETRFCSSRNQMVNHPAYQEIIRLGNAAVPFLIEDLRAEPHYWFPALQAITGDDPVAPEDRGSVRKMAAAWLDWAGARGL